MAVTINIDELKNAQEELKKQLEELDTQISQKETRGEVNYDIIETKSLVKKLIKENEKIAQKIDYLLAILAEAAEQTEDTSVIDSIKTLLKTQTEVINYLSKIAEKDFSVDISPVINSVESLKSDISVISDKVLQLMNKIPEEKQIELLKTRLDEISQKLTNIEERLNTPKEIHLPEMDKIHEDFKNLKSESDILSSKLNQLIEISKRPNHEQEILEKIDALNNRMNLMEAEIIKKKELIDKMIQIEDNIQNVLKNYHDAKPITFDEILEKLEDLRKSIPEAPTTRTFHEKLAQIVEKISGYKKRKENAEKIKELLNEVEFSIQEGNLERLEMKLKELEEIIGLDKELPVIKRLEELEERIDALLRIKEQVTQQTKETPPEPVVKKIGEIHETVQKEQESVKSKSEVIDEFINKLSPGTSIKIQELAEKLGMDVHELEDYLIDLSHRRKDIKLKNFGFLAKLLHKEHLLVKVE